MLVWSTSPGAMAYTIQLSASVGFNSLIVNQSISDTTYTVSGLSVSTRYYWRVRAENLGGGSPWSNATMTTRLNVPAPASPADGAVNISLKPNITWSAIGLSSKYTFQLSTQSDFSVPARSIDTSVTQLLLDSLSRGTTYYWRVRAFLRGDTTSYSTPRSFSTIPLIPTAPTPIFPPDAATNIAVNAVLRWSKVQNAKSYRLQVSRSPIFSTLIKDSTVFETLYRPQPFFTPATQYFWRVSSTTEGGTSSYSGTNRFTAGTDINKAKIVFSHVNLGTVNAGTVKDTTLIISNMGSDDLIIKRISPPVPIWTFANTGIESLSIRSFAVVGSSIFVGTQNGVYRSTNMGKTWTSTGFPGTGSVNAFAVWGTNLFAASQSKVFHSSIEGVGWGSVNLQSSELFDLAVSGPYLFAAGSTWIHRSGNGQNWSFAAAGMGYGPYYSIAVSDTCLYIGGRLNGIYRSTNNGTSWDQTGFRNPEVYRLAIAGANLYAGTASGLYLSTKNWTEWTLLSNGLPVKPTRAITISGKYLFAGNGSDYNTPGQVKGGAVYRSTNNGADWDLINAGLPGSSIWSLAVSGINLFAATDSGVFRTVAIEPSCSIADSIMNPGTSTTASIHFLSLPMGVINSKIIILSNAVSSPDTVSITGFGALSRMSVSSTSIFVGPVALGQSKDTVVTLANTGNVDLTIKSISSDNRFFTTRSSAAIIAGGASIKDTIHFSPITNGFVSGKIIITSNAPSSPDTITISGFGETYGMALSSKALNLGSVKVGQRRDTVISITNTGTGNLEITNIVSDNRLFTANPSALTIAPLASALDTIRFTPTTAGNASGKMVVSSNIASEMDTIAVNGYGALYELALSAKTIDMGNVAIGKTKDTVIAIKNTGNIELAISGVNSSSQAFAVSQKRIIVDTGKIAFDTIRFMPAAEGSVTGIIVVSSDAISSPDTVTMTGNGVLTSVREGLDIPSVYSLSQNYPNPFNPSTTLRYGIPEKSRVKLCLFNILGQQMEPEIIAFQNAGYYEHTFNASQLSSGIYFYTIEATSEQNPGRIFMDTKKMVLMR